MKIVKLNTNNVLRLRAIEIVPTDDAVIIGGRNEQGKTSVLDSIMLALGGRLAKHAEPLRRGSKRGVVRCDLGDLVVTRTFTADGGTLTVTNAAGEKQPAPQTMLDKFYSSLTFDPLAFATMDSTSQVAVLKRLAGIRFDDIDAARTAAYEDRTIANRMLKAAEARISGAKIDSSLRSSEIDVSTLTSDLLDIERKNASVDKAIDTKERLRESISSINEEIASMQSKIDDLRRNMESKERESVALDELIIPKTDTSALREKIASAESMNKSIRINEQLKASAAEVKQYEAMSSSLTQRIDMLDEERSTRLATARMPVESLSFSEDGIMIDGIPFSQASSARKIRVSIGMGIAMNPELKVMLVREGSLLDDENLAIVKDAAKDHDMQIWIERVGHGDECSFVIEDGAVVGANMEIEANV